MMINATNPNIEFNAQDRCDRCQSQAYVSASRDGLELMFCRHHSAKYNLALELDDWVLAYDLVALERLVDGNNKVSV
jgi:hypothetical protein